MSSLPEDIHQHVYDNWGAPGCEAAEYVYDLLNTDIKILEDENDALLFGRDSVEELRSKVEEAINILNSVN